MIAFQNTPLQDKKRTGLGMLLAALAHRDVTPPVGDYQESEQLGMNGLDTNSGIAIYHPSTTWQ